MGNSMRFFDLGSWATINVCFARVQATYSIRLSSANRAGSFSSDARVLQFTLVSSTTFDASMPLLA